MSSYLGFEGRVEATRLGRAVYTMIRVPEHIQAALKAVRVDAEINGYETNLALRRTPGGDGWCIWVGKSALDQIGVAPGGQIVVRLRKADADKVETPEDVMTAFRDAGRVDDWAKLTAGKQRSLLYQVNSAKRAQTRAKRIAKLVAEVTA